MVLTPQQCLERENITRMRSMLASYMSRHVHVAKQIEECEAAICAICDEQLGWWCPDSPDNVCHYFTEVNSSDEPTLVTKLLNKSTHILTDEFNIKNLNCQSKDRCLFCGQPAERL